jgi:hypothetical protein
MEILVRTRSFYKQYQSNSYIAGGSNHDPDKVLYLVLIVSIKDYKYLMYIGSDITGYKGPQSVKYFKYLIYTENNTCTSDKIVYSRLCNKPSDYRIIFYNYGIRVTKYNNKTYNILLQNYDIGRGCGKVNMYFDLYGSLLKINYFRLDINMENISVQDIIKMNYAVPLPIIIA